MVVLYFFFFQAEEGIRDVEGSRGLGNVYKGQNAVREKKIKKSASQAREN